MAKDTQVELDYKKDISPIIKEQVEGAWDNIQSHYEIDKRDAEEVESKSRDGFIPFTDGGWNVSGFQTLQYFDGTGKRMPSDKSKKIFEGQVAKGYESAKDWFKEEYPEIFEELGEDKINYSDLQEAGYNDEAEELSGAEMDNLSDDNSTIMFELGVYYYEPDNSKNEFKGKQACYVYGVVNFEAPYHRSQDKWEDSVSENFSFESKEELETKLREALQKVLGWFGASKEYSLGGVLLGVGLGIAGLFGYQKSKEVSAEIKENEKISIHEKDRDTRIREHQAKMRARQDELRKQGLPKEIRFRHDRENGSEKVTSVHQKMVDGKWQDISKEEYDDLATIETEWNSDISLYKAKHKTKKVGKILSKDGWYIHVLDNKKMASGGMVCAETMEKIKEIYNHLSKEYGVEEYCFNEAENSVSFRKEKNFTPNQRQEIDTYLKGKVSVGAYPLYGKIDLRGLAIMDSHVELRLEEPEKEGSMATGGKAGIANSGISWIITGTTI